MQCEGIGEKLTRLKDLPDCWMVVVKPSVGACTENIYKALDDCGFNNADMAPVLKGIEAGDLAGVASSMDNVLESVTVKQLPVIENIKGFLKSHGALGASMTGSGSATFGIFADEASARRAAEDFESEFDACNSAGQAPEYAENAEGKAPEYAGNESGQKMAYNIYVVKTTKNSQRFC